MRGCRAVQLVMMLNRRTERVLEYLCEDIFEVDGNIAALHVRRALEKRWGDGDARKRCVLIAVHDERRRCAKRCLTKLTYECTTHVHHGGRRARHVDDAVVRDTHMALYLEGLRQRDVLLGDETD